MTQEKTTNIDIKKMKAEVAAKQKLAKSEEQGFWISTKNVIIALWQVTIFASIVFSTVIIFIGTDDNTTKILTLPAASYAAYLLLNKFLKK